MIQNKANLATVMLLLGVLFWGITFSVIKEAVEFVDVFSFISVRFLIASFLLLLIFIKRIKRYNLEILKKESLLAQYWQPVLFFKPLVLN